MNYFKHQTALVETSQIGEKSRIWAFVHILPGAKIGKNANICDYCFIENDVVLGNNVTIKCGVYLWNGLQIEDNVFIGPSVVFTNDKHPRSKNTAFEQKNTTLKKGCSIGANATILPGVTIGKYAMVGAGAVVTKDVNDFEVIYGNPAHHQGFICSCGNKLDTSLNEIRCECGKKYIIKNDQINQI